MKILLVNPPIYDFSAYDFWLKPYGMLQVAGKLRHCADFSFFDYLDRTHSFYKTTASKTDTWGRGRFYSEKISRPEVFADIPRNFQRFGLPRDLFIDFLKSIPEPDFAFIQTTMTYWYPGYAEVIEDIRKVLPDTKIILGGNYATLCPDHAGSLGADFVLSGTDLSVLWRYLNVSAQDNSPALWEVYDRPDTTVIKISDGCPFKCTYCSVPKVYSGFKPRSSKLVFAELDQIARSSAKNLAFYDDALLFESQKVLVPFLEEVIKRDIHINLHCPNALNARFITGQLAELMVRAGFKTFYLGFESSSKKWQKATGSKVFSDELTDAVGYLKAAGVEPGNITVYQILGHPEADLQKLEDTMHFVYSLGVKGMLSDFSPIPGTVDGENCSRYIDITEPLMHNKTAFPAIFMGFDQSNRFKDLQRKLNASLS